MIGGSLGGNYRNLNIYNLKTKKKNPVHLITYSFTTKTGYFFLPDFAVGLNSTY